MSYLVFVYVLSVDDLQAGKWFSKLHGKRYGGAYALDRFEWTATSEFVAIANKLSSHTKDVYEFGVYTGGSMKGIAERVRGFDTLWGFDSFTGLPEEEAGIKKEGRHWNSGAFSSADAFHTYNSVKLFERLRQKINHSNVQFVSGFFNETLTEQLLHKRKFKPALIIDVDSDLYISAKNCIEWMIRSHLLVPGSLLRYDDWKGDASWGESRAHMELTNKFKLKWKNITVIPGMLAEFQLVSCETC